MKKRWLALSLISLAAFIMPVLNFAGLADAACANTPDATKGTDTLTMNVTTAGTYTVWSQMSAPDTTNNSYYLQIDGGCAIDVGDNSAIPSSATWVNYQNGSTSSPITVSLTAGSHQVLMTGREPGVSVAQLLFLSDASCVPTGTGSNCTPAPDTTKPTVSVTSPASGATVSGTTTVTATATDNVKVTSLQFQLDGTNIGSPIANTGATGAGANNSYSYSWNTTTATNANHSLTATATDGTNTGNSSAVTVTVSNGGSGGTGGGGTGGGGTGTGQIQNLAFNATTKTLSWTPYSGASSYSVVQKDITSGVTSYAWPHVSAASCIPGGSCNIPAPAKGGDTVRYNVSPLDANGAQIGTAWITPEITATWPSVADTTPPSQPTGLTATTLNASQINLSWTASTDNTGVTGYKVYRSQGGNTAQLVATSPTNSFGDTGLQANATYTYYVQAVDAAGNVSAKSATASATTVTVTGQIQNLAFNSSTKTLSWSAYSGASKYVVAQVHNPTTTRNKTNYSWPHINTTSCNPGGSCNIPAPAVGETVNYNVQPLDANGHMIGTAWVTKEITVKWP